MNDKILIVGAGLAGCTCARLLADKNYKIDIIDKNNHIGGTCYDYKSDDNTCYIHKYGPHIFHTNIKEVWQFINRFDIFNNYKHQVKALCNNNLYIWPININTINQIFNTNISTELQINQLIHDKYYNNPQNFQEEAINNVGTKLYEMFIKTYSQNQWKCTCNKLPASLFKRIKIKYNFNNNFFEDIYQGMPVSGYTGLILNMLDNKNINVDLEQDFYKLKNINNYDKIIYTGGFNNLPYRSIEFIHYKDNKKDYNVINLSQNKYFTRVTDFNNLHKINESNNLHNFCKQRPCNNNEFNELYPINNKQNNELYLEEKNKLIYKYSNIILSGRLALYKYFNMDDTIIYSMNIIKNYF